MHVSGRHIPVWIKQGIITVLALVIFDPLLAFAQYRDLSEITAVNRVTGFLNLDIDSDGDQDIVYYSRDDTRLVWHENEDGRGAFGPQILIASNLDADVLQAGDINNDKRSDLILASSFPNEVFWFANEGGTFGTKQILLTDTELISAILIDDLDGDGDDDLYTGAHDGSMLVWYENLDGAGQFGSRQIISDEHQWVEAIHLTDIDGDGDLDALMATPFSSNFYAYENLDGKGSFGNEQLIDGAIYFASSITSADFDGDGDQDLVAAGGDGSDVSRIYWFENLDGAGNFSDKKEVFDADPYYSRSWIFVYAADVDNDTDPDIVAVYPDFAYAAIAWFENQDLNSATFSEEKIIQPATDDSLWTKGISLGDLDSDGDTDVLALMGRIEERLGWYRNLSENPGVFIKVVGAEEAGITQIGWGTLRVSTTSRYFQDLPANGFAYLRSELKEMFFDDGFELRRINLLGPDGKVLGHVVLDYTEEDYEAKKRVDAVLFVHTEQSLVPSFDKYPNTGLFKWQYYQEGEHPVAMVLPPKESVEAIESGRQPIVVVHGVSSTYPNWRGTLLSDLNNQYDIWQFYYPYDQGIPQSGKMLGKAIKMVLSPSHFISEDLYDARDKLPVIAHSMGGLVTRSYIQSELYDKDISKLLILGTPNHGARSAFETFHEHNLIDEIVDVFNSAVFDDQAPAYHQMIPGSRFLLSLNTKSPLKLQSNKEIRDTYLVVAGTKDKIPLAHTEILGQEDGIVAVSSASLTNFGIPLVTTPLVHTSLNTELPVEVVSVFFDPNYTYTSFAINRVGSLAGYYTTDVEGRTVPVTEDRRDNSIDNHRGMLSLYLKGETTYSGKLSDLGDLEVAREGNRFVFTEGADTENYMLRHNVVSRLEDQADDEALFFSSSYRRFEGVEHDISFGFPEGAYITVFQKKIPFLEPIPFAVLQGFLPFRHLQTVTASISLSGIQTAVLTAGNFLPTTTQPSKRLAAHGTVKDDAVFEVDASVNPLVVLLGASNDFTDHGLSLIAPDGQVIDATLADVDGSIHFEEDINEHYAYFVIENPKVGEWTASYNAALDDAALGVPILSPLEVSIEIESDSLVSGDKLKFLVVAPVELEMPAASVRVSFEGEQIAEQTLVAASPGVFAGEFLPAAEGVYEITADASALSGGTAIHRLATKSVMVSQGMTSIRREPEHRVENEWALENFPNPAAFSTQIQLVVPENTNVELAIFDVLGRRVQTVVDRLLSIGRYSISVDVSSLPAGIYFYRLASPQYTVTKQLVIAR